MKHILLAVATFLLMFTGLKAGAQARIDSSSLGKTFEVILKDNSTYTGKMIRLAGGDIIIHTKALGDITIPKLQIQTINEVPSNQEEIDSAHLEDNAFATRYFMSTNGLPAEAGQTYIRWNWFGPDVQYAVSDQLTIGLMATWIGAPLLGDIKVSIPLAKDLNLGVGVVAGTGLWVFPEFKLALPFGALTYGDRRNNITFSGGYGYVNTGTNSGGRMIYSAAGMLHLSKKVSIVFDSFILPGNKSDNDYAGLFLPGLRIQSSNRSAFQFGYMAVSTINGTSQVPIPMAQWFRKLK